MLRRRPFANRTLAWVSVLALGVVSNGVSPYGQQDDPYRQLLRLYRQNPGPAALSLTRLSSQVIDTGVSRCILSYVSGNGAYCGLQDLLAGAMLHAETAERLIGENADVASAHIRFGRKLLQSVRDGRMFGGRWYAFVARILLAHGYRDDASVIVSEGRIRYKDSADLYVVSGVMTEWRVGVGAGDIRGAILRAERFDQMIGSQSVGAPIYRGNTLQRLESAAADYRRALAADPANTTARVRLGWGHLLAGDPRVWEDLSLEFLAAADAETRFLSRLIRGTAAERERRTQAALDEYQEARLADPDSQTACVAVSSAQAQAGKLPEARQTAADCLRLGNDASRVDSWTLFRMGLMDKTTMAWLQREARRP